jgi:hypothetical protein
MGEIARALPADFEAPDELRAELIASGRADSPTIGALIHSGLATPTDSVLVANGLVWHMGVEWLRADALDRVEIAYGWLSKGARPVQVADELRRIADVLDNNPVEYLQAQLKRLMADVLARCPECDEEAA